MKTIQSLFQSCIHATETLKTTAILAALLCGLVGQAEAQIYVDASADPGGNGSSWDMAYNDLQVALDNAASGVPIWVAEGVYTPTDDPDDRTATFQLQDEVEILGGFPTGGGTRDWEAHPTILSGDIGGDDTDPDMDGVITNPDDINGSNSYHVVTAGNGITLTTRLNGFTITAGNANGTGINSRGGGMFIPFSTSSPNSPTLTNLTFSGNRAGSLGGGMDNSESPTLTNVTFTGNQADFFGGGMLNGSGSPVLTNVILWGNQAGDTGNEILNGDDSTPIITHSLIAGGCPAGSDCGGGSTILDADPQFETPVNPDNAPTTAGNLNLTSTSPAINTGDPETDLSVFPTNDDGDAVDLAGNDRVFNGSPAEDIIDMGAYEFQADPFATPDENNILYVNQDVDTGASGYDGSGSSWDNAIPELADALQWANDEWDGSTPPLQIWVADGTYKPLHKVAEEDDVEEPTTERDQAFILTENVQIYGGFTGGESTPGDRDLDNPENETILSGNLGDEESYADNAYHVVIASGEVGSALLDGVTVTKGYANGSFTVPVINDNSIERDRGGGMYNINSGSPENSLTLRDVTFADNLAEEAGGGMLNNTSSPTLTNVTFFDNTAVLNGAGMANLTSSPELMSVIFADNATNEGSGGGMFNIFDSSPTLTNVTFAGNSVDSNGAGIYNSSDGDSPDLTNVILWDNLADENDEEIATSSLEASPTISHSLIQGGCPEGSDCGDGSTILDVDPHFVDAGDPAGPDGIFGTADDGLRLRSTSPAINAGDPATDLVLFPGGPDNPLDLAGEPRVFADGVERIDIGAYEFQGDPETPLILTMDEGWRMLSNPITGQSYAGMLAPLWTQGVDGADYSGGEPNVYTWNIGYSGDCTFEYNNNQECEGWQVPSSDAFAEAITPGTGFLVYVFADDVYGETEEDPFPKDLTLTGTRHSGQVSPEINQNGAGWTLVGNPYGSPIDFARVDRTAVQDIAYVYDANADPDAVPDDGPTNGNGGAWRSTVDGTYGDITDGIIAPGQGFFVQSSMDDAAELIFSPSDQIDGGEFYGKEKQRRDFVRLEVQGESLYNSAWIRFSEEGSLERTKGEALELQPLDSHYAIMGARKTDGTLMDIAHYPLDTQELEIPLAVEATQSGQFTIRATDLDLPAGMTLYLYDRQRGESVPIGEDFEYTFDLEISDQGKNIPPYEGGTEGGVLRAKDPTPQEILAIGAIGPSKATTTGEDRFVLTTTPGGPASELPDEVALGQNYPNPFNPATVIRYQLPASSEVRLEVYDMLGRRVATLVDEQVAAGRHQVNFDASRLSSGVYLYRLTARGADGGSQIFTKKLTLIK